MYTLTLNDGERASLIETLEASLATLPHEIHHTDSRAYRTLLEEKQRTLQQLLRRLSRPRVVRRHGRFVLVESEAGFAWTLASGAGDPWYWHPQTREWTAHPVASPTPEAAAEGFDPDAPHAAARPRPRGGVLHARLRANEAAPQTDEM
jgi:hypothetical protein